MLHVILPSLSVSRPISSVPWGLQLSIQASPPWDGATAEAGQIPGPHQAGPQGQGWSLVHTSTNSPRFSWHPWIPMDQNENLLLTQAHAAPHCQKETAGKTKLNKQV